MDISYISFQLLAEAQSFEIPVLTYFVQKPRYFLCTNSLI